MCVKVYICVCVCVCVSVSVSVCVCVGVADSKWCHGLDDSVYLVDEATHQISR